METWPGSLGIWLRIPTIRDEDIQELATLALALYFADTTFIFQHLICTIPTFYDFLLSFPLSKGDKLGRHKSTASRGTYAKGRERRTSEQIRIRGHCSPQLLNSIYSQLSMILVAVLVPDLERS